MPTIIDFNNADAFLATTRLSASTKKALLQAIAAQAGATDLASDLLKLPRSQQTRIRSTTKALNEMRDERFERARREAALISDAEWERLIGDE